MLRRFRCGIMSFSALTRRRLLGKFGHAFSGRLHLEGNNRMSSLPLVTAVALLVCLVPVALSYRRQKSTGQLLVMVILLAAVGLQVYSLWKGPRPQLDLKNVGASSILLRHDGADLVVSPGGTGHFRYSPGDALTIFATKEATGESKTVSLPAAMDGSLLRVVAEVNADDAAQIDFRVVK
jgi:hypothetical protein